MLPVRQKQPAIPTFARLAPELCFRCSRPSHRRPVSPVQRWNCPSFPCGRGSQRRPLLLVSEPELCFRYRNTFLILSGRSRRRRPVLPVQRQNHASHTEEKAGNANFCSFSARHMILIRQKQPPMPFFNLLRGGTKLPVRQKALLFPLLFIQRENYSTYGRSSHFQRQNQASCTAEVTTMPTFSCLAQELCFQFGRSSV